MRTRPLSSSQSDMQSGSSSFLVRAGLRQQPLSTSDRLIYANNWEANQGFVDNIIITSKYTWWNFVPLFLFTAFMRLANAYFLVVCVLQSIPQITITNGVPTSALPLGIVLLFDGTASAREDYKRHVDDAIANNSKTLVVRNGKFVEVAWAGIVVGDLLKITRNCPVPADCVFLASHSQEGGAPDACYVQTAQLDGETNLKLKTAPRQSVECLSNDAACLGFQGRVRCEAPSAAFDKFVGTLQLDAEGRGAAVPLEAENLLLRGSVLRNVDNAYALVVYTGRETKVRVRQTTRKFKSAQVESQLNAFILCLIALLLTVCVVGTVGNVLHVNSNHPGQWYFGEQRSSISATAAILQFFTFFLLNASFIPVSLYVSVRLARTVQVLFMEADDLMVHRDEEQYSLSDGLEGEYPFKVRSMELNDELGQITHIFSDKTGTLTLNYMEWRKLLVGSVAYGLGTTQIGIDRMRRAGQDVSHLEGALQAEKLRGKERGAQLPHVNFEDGSAGGMGRTLGSDARDPCDGAQGTAIHDMLLHLALNHTVLPEVVRDKHGVAVGCRLSASSPDEEAFCYAAETLGYKFVSRTQEGVCLNIRHATQDMPFQRSAAPFTIALKTKSNRLLQGERKCMSVVVEHPMVDTEGCACVTGGEGGQRGDIYIYCKGADSAILPKCVPPATPSEAAALELSKATLNDWGNDGLRTLVFACRRLPRAEYEAWAVRYAAACQDLGQLKLRKDKRPNAIDDLQMELEVGLRMQGATANEDKLQPEVPETLSLLGRAGIKLWMVTGDKQETAVNIGFATKLLDASQRHIVVTTESAGGVLQAMKRLRIAAKRMRAERKSEAEARAAASARAGGMESYGLAGQVMQWINRKLVAAESAAASSGRSSGGSGGAAREQAATSPPSDTSPTAAFSFGSMRTAALDLPPKAGRLVEPSQGQRTGAEYDSDEDEERLAEGEAADAAIGNTGPGSAPATPVVGDHQRLLAAPAGASGAGAASPAVVLMNPAHASALRSGSEGGEGLPAAASHRPFALVIDEHCLDAALQNPRAKGYLLYVSVNCDAVIACRARPDQKAQLVRLVRAGLPSARTLAVGDGANDVDMIGAAHVGVGIAGAEGVQAANASDFSIGRFKFLQRLLLVHGRWNYSRMARVVLYMFWKNVFFVLCQFIFQINFNGFSGQKWYVEWAAQAFNLVFTGAAPLVMGVLDRDLDAPWVLRYPKLYDFGRLAMALPLPVFLSWMADAVVCAVVVFFFTTQGFKAPDFAAGAPGGGATPFVFSMGTVAYSSIVVVTNVRIAAEVFHHSFLFQAVVALSALLWVPVCFILDALKQDGMYGGMRQIFGSANFWLTVLLASGALSLRLVLWKGYKRMFMPDLRHCVQEVAALGLSSRSIDSYTDSADLARRLGKSVAEVVQAHKAANTAAEALDTNLRVIPMGSPLIGGGIGGAGSARLDHFGSSPLRIAPGHSDPNEGGYSALNGGPFGGNSGGGGSSSLNPTAGLAAVGSSSSSSSSSAVGSLAGGAAATPHLTPKLQERTARSIMEISLRPLALPGDSNFDAERFPGELDGVDSPVPGRPLVGLGGANAGGGSSSKPATVTEETLETFKAHVSGAVSRISSSSSSGDAPRP